MKRKEFSIGQLTFLWLKTSAHMCVANKKSRPANLYLPRCFAIGAWATGNSKLEITKTKNANPRCAGGRASGVHICTRAGLFVLLPFLMVRAWVVLFANRESHPGSKSSPLMNIARGNSLLAAWTAHFRLVSEHMKELAARRDDESPRCKKNFKHFANTFIQQAPRNWRTWRERVLKVWLSERRETASDTYVHYFLLRRRRCESEMINYSSLIIQHWRLSPPRSDSSNEALVWWLDTPKTLSRRSLLRMPLPVIGSNYDWLLLILFRDIEILTGISSLCTKRLFVSIKFQGILEGIENLVHYERPVKNE